MSSELSLNKTLILPLSPDTPFYLYINPCSETWPIYRSPDSDFGLDQSWSRSVMIQIWTWSILVLILIPKLIILLILILILLLILILPLILILGFILILIHRSVFLVWSWSRSRIWFDPKMILIIKSGSWFLFWSRLKSKFQAKLKTDVYKLYTTLWSLKYVCL